VTGLNILLELTRDLSFHGNCIQIGRQTIHLSSEQFLQCARRWSLEPRAISLLSSASSIDDQLLFRLLEFDSVESIDYSNYENPTHVADLNLPVPSELHGRYDFIYDGGSSEHIFNFPQVLCNYHSMLKPGGILAHAIPATNHLDHGFYMFSPTLLWDYYLANNYKILRAYLVEYNLNAALAGKPSTVWNYDPSRILNSFSGWHSSNILNWFVVQKLSGSTSGCIPQQGAYLGVEGWDRQDIPRQDIIQLLPKPPANEWANWRGPATQSHQGKLFRIINNVIQKSLKKLVLASQLQPTRYTITQCNLWAISECHSSCPTDQNAC
jgi:SAM-dependent methyltransferase